MIRERSGGLFAIWVRRTVNWTDEEAFLAQVAPAFRGVVDVWNETFTTPFHIFRGEVRRIAGLNHAAVHGAVCRDWDEIPDGAVVLPVDDDDWFAPDIAETITRHQDPRAEAYRWESSFLEVPIGLGHRLYVLRQQLFPGGRPRHSCTTNNYAVVKGVGAQEIAASHMRASEWVDGAGPDRVTWIPGRLSMQNRTMASKTSLGNWRPDITRSQLIRKLRQYGQLYRRSEGRGLVWARPYVAMMATLTKQLEVRD